MLRLRALVNRLKSRRLAAQTRAVKHDLEDELSRERVERRHIGVASIREFRALGGQRIHSPCARSTPFEMAGFIDLHCHWVAAIDDGARTFEQGLDMLRRLQSAGFAKVVATPHMRPGMFDNDKAMLER